MVDHMDGCFWKTVPLGVKQLWLEIIWLYPSFSMITCSAGLGFWFQDSITSNFISCPNVCNPEIKIRNIKDIKEIKIISLKTVTEGNNCLFERNVVIKRPTKWKGNVYGRLLA